jgi:hypothetical protein
MSSTSTPKPNFVPIESIITFAFIGAVVLVGLIARCLASNHTTIHSVESRDLMIYREAPRPAPVPKPRLASVEQQFHSQSDSQDKKTLTEDPVIPARIQRGPKNL